MSSTSRWAQAEVAYARATLAFSEGASERVRDELSQALPQTPEQRVRYTQLRAWIYGLSEHFEQQAMHLLNALSLATKESVDRGLVSRIAEALAPLVREIELGEIGNHAEAILEKFLGPKSK